ncbi:dynein axonemal assembly factor 1 [Venturia canescens]|uniref:dynein axonemal assembly factor 1 n=1 Tax=Venturia canescens TaxID=32260 RepID=UPI001C9D17CC|nr:dynein axonemal assembly factor 1 [Venturia canescens]XP_043279049.1 dynein axonemal assembly factor 1 [Venturia canescens]XP_043279050.1 dynein axonemal assembly factor 1 [Venturia canescens]
MDVAEMLNELERNSEIPKNEEEALLLIKIIAIEKERIEREKNEALNKLDLELLDSQTPSTTNSEHEMPVTHSEANTDLNKREAVPCHFEENRKNLGRPTDENDESLAAPSDNDDSSLDDDYEEPDYVQDKIYDFDDKKHGIRMTEKLIKDHCKKERLYQTPHLNDVLFLHYKGFSFIENLMKYTGLKTLWLENNGIQELANLDNQKELKCLYLHHNLISKIENLEALSKLDTLNLSYNTIRKIENLDQLKHLNTLNLAHNYLQSLEDIEHLRLLEALSILDLSHNRLDEPVGVTEVLSSMRSLSVVTLTGNPVVKCIANYRKTMILGCKKLHYLDERPVFPRDRACAEAWERGGHEEEMAERKRWIEAEQQKINESVQALMRKRKSIVPVYEGSEESAKIEEDASEVEESKELLVLENKCAKSEARLATPSDSEGSSDDEKTEETERIMESEDGAIRKFVEEIQTMEHRRPVVSEENVRVENSSEAKTVTIRIEDDDKKSGEAEIVGDPGIDVTESEEISIPTKLSEIRQGMKDFRDQMCKFDKENKIVYNKNGEIERIWGHESISEWKNAIEPMPDSSSSLSSNLRVEEEASEILENPFKLTGESPKSRIVETIRATKSDESIGRNHHSADNQIRTSCQAMTEGKTIRPEELLSNVENLSDYSIKIEESRISEATKPIESPGDCRVSKKSLEMILALGGDEKNE